MGVLLGRPLPYPSSGKYRHDVTYIFLPTLILFFCFMQFLTKTEGNEYEYTVLVFLSVVFFVVRFLVNMAKQ